MILFGPPRYIEHKCNGLANCTKRVDDIEQHPRCPGYCPPFFRVLYDTELKKWWIIANEEYSFLIDYCPYCGKKLDFTPNSKEQSMGKESLKITHLKKDEPDIIDDSCKVIKSLLPFVKPLFEEKFKHFTVKIQFHARHDAFKTVDLIDGFQLEVE